MSSAEQYADEPYSPSYTERIKDMTCLAVAFPAMAWQGACTGAAGAGLVHLIAEKADLVGAGTTLADFVSAGVFAGESIGIVLAGLFMCKMIDKYRK